mmetsp:Transcript_38382/g.73545  ORF Transcript_38382/g.73545 Transcript_38382/m.73545 type:complete len:320 (-) Transcript_38382:1661-2620(-)
MRARLVQPGVDLVLSVARKHLPRAHVVEDGQQHRVKHAAPEGFAEDVAVDAQDVEQHFQRALADRGARVKRQLRQTGKKREPEVDMHVVVQLSHVAWGRGPGGAFLHPRGGAGHLQLSNGSLRQLERAEAQKRDGVEGNVHVEVGVGEGDEAVDTVREGGRLSLGDVRKVLAHNLLHRLEGEGDDGALLVGGSGGEHHKHGLPAGFDVAHAHQHHLAHTPDDELASLHASALAHDHHKRLEEVVLELVVGQLVPLQELHRQLAQAVHRVHGDLQVRVASDSDEVVRQHVPDARPHEPDAGHVEVRNLHNFGERKNSRPV